MIAKHCHRTRRAAFTLIEVIVAVLVVMMLAVSLAQFLRVNLEAIGSMTETGIEQERTNALLRYVQAELNSLPLEREGGADGALLGAAFKMRGLSGDAMTWLSKPGSGVLTNAALGQFRTTLLLVPQSATSTVYDLGLRRRPVEGSDKDVNWLPLIPDVAAMEIYYLNAMNRQWEPRWNDRAKRPALVRIRLWKTKGAMPVEAILGVNSSRVN